MRRYKVLHIITRFDKGGSAENTFLSIVGLNPDRFEVSLVKGTSLGFYVSDSEEVANQKNLRQLQKLRVKTTTIPFLIRAPHPLYDLLTFMKLFVLIKTGRYDIVHTHTSKAGILGRWAAFLAGTPIIIHTPHGHIFNKYFNPLLSFIFLSVEKVSALITDKIITLTKGCNQEHIDLGIAYSEKFTIIHSGIDFKKFKKNISNSLTKRDIGVEHGDAVIGTIGRLVSIKGHKYLLDAAKEVKQAIPNLKLLFIGEGELRQELEEQTIRLGLSQNVIFLGWREDIPKILPLFDVFALPSLNEGMGKVLVEAMYQKIPIVASDIGGIPELVINEENGLLVPPEKPKDLAAALIKLLKDSSIRADMGERGKKRARLYSADRMVEMIETLYDEFIQKMAL